MPYKKKPFAKRTYRRKAKPRKKKSAMAPMSIRSLKVDYSTIIPVTTELVYLNSSSAPPKWGSTFSLDKCMNYTQYAMWDQYRINWVEVRFTPVLSQVVTTDNDVTGAVTLSYQVPDYCVYVDRDDATAPVDYDSLKVRKGAVVRPMIKPYIRKFRPNILSATYDDGITDAYALDKAAPWLDLASSGAPHYGIKFATQIWGQTAQYGIKYDVRYCVSFANRRT